MFIVASVLQQIQVLLFGNFLEFFFNSFDLWMPNWQIQRAGWLRIYWKNYLSISGPVHSHLWCSRVSYSSCISRGHHRAMLKPGTITRHHSLEK